MPASTSNMGGVSLPGRPKTCVKEKAGTEVAPGPATLRLHAPRYRLRSNKLRRQRQRQRQRQTTTTTKKEPYFESLQTGNANIRWKTHARDALAITSTRERSDDHIMYRQLLGTPHMHPEGAGKKPGVRRRSWMENCESVSKPQPSRGRKMLEQVKLDDLHASTKLATQ